MVGGKDTICRKHNQNQNREPKCNFTITTLSRTNKTVNDTKKFTIPRNSVFIAVNDCWATKDSDTYKGGILDGCGKIGGGPVSGTLGATEVNNVVGGGEEKRRHRQPVIKAESLPQYCDKNDSIERKSTQRRSSNESATIGGSISGGICYATFSKGMYKPQHIYENDCIIQRSSATAAAGRNCASTTPVSLQSTDLADDGSSNGAAAGGSLATNPPLYAVVNKNNKTKNKQSSELIAAAALLKQQQNINDCTPTNNLLLNNNNNTTNSNSNNNSKLKTSNHPSNILICPSDTTSDIMGNMLQTESTILERNAGGDQHHHHQQQQQHHYLHQGLAANKNTPSSSQSFDEMITTTSITADMRNDSNAEHSIYAKVWKGPRKTSESKMYD